MKNTNDGWQLDSYVDVRSPCDDRKTYRRDVLMWVYLIVLSRQIEEKIYLYLLTNYHNKTFTIFINFPIYIYNQ